MKRAMTLEQERQALLEQIHASRAAYRRMLAQYDEPAPEDVETARQAHARAHAMGLPDAFPRSATMRWVMAHPYAAAGIAAGLTALVIAGPGMTRKLRSQPRVRSALHGMGSRLRDGLQSIGAHVPWRGAQASQLPPMKTPSAGGTAVAGVMGLATMLLRDPARMRMAVQAVTQAVDWLRQRRTASHSRPAPRGRAVVHDSPSAGTRLPVEGGEVHLQSSGGAQQLH